MTLFTDLSDLGRKIWGSSRHLPGLPARTTHHLPSIIAEDCVFFIPHDDHRNFEIPPYIFLLAKCYRYFPLLGCWIDPAFTLWPPEILVIYSVGEYPKVMSARNRRCSLDCHTFPNFHVVSRRISNFHPELLCLSILARTQWYCMWNNPTARAAAFQRRRESR